MNRHTGRVSDHITWQLTHDGTMGLSESSVTVVSCDERHVILDARRNL